MAKDLLVVDDEAVITGAVLKICGAEGLSADAAEDGAKALELAGRETYRLILCDIMMPGLDGFGLLAQLSRRSQGPVVVISGYSTLENAVRALACGAADFLPKPFTADEVLAAVTRGLALGALPAPGREAPEGARRLGRLSWALLEPSGTARLGVCASFLRSLSDLERLELQAPGESVAQGAPFAHFLCAGGLRHGAAAPLSGRILECRAAAAEPAPEDWLYRILPSSLEYDLRSLSSTPPEASPW